MNVHPTIGIRKVCSCSFDFSSLLLSPAWLTADLLGIIVISSLFWPRMSDKWNHRLCSQASLALPHIFWYLGMLCLMRSLFFFFFDWEVFHCGALMQFPFFRLCLCYLSKAAKDQSVHVSLWACVWNSLLIPTARISASWANTRLTSWDSCTWFPRRLYRCSICSDVWTFQLCNILTHIWSFHSCNFSHSVYCITFFGILQKACWPLLQMAPALAVWIHSCSSLRGPNWYLSSLSSLSFSCGYFPSLLSTLSSFSGFFQLQVW